MRIKFYASDKHREAKVVAALSQGFKRLGHTFTATFARWEPGNDVDLALFFGIKRCREYQQAAMVQQCNVVVLDKGYCRSTKGGWQYIRISVGAHHPTGYIMRVPCNKDRFSKLGFNVKPWKPWRNRVLIAGSSEKYHRAYGLPHPTQYAQDLADACKALGLGVVYRPKPSWARAVPLQGHDFSPPQQSLYEALDTCGVMLTHGSNACVEAMVHGVPVVALGPAICRPISPTEVEDVYKTRHVSDNARQLWLQRMAHCQYTLDEFKRGDGVAALFEHRGLVG